MYLRVESMNEIDMPDFSCMVARYIPGGAGSMTTGIQTSAGTKLKTQIHKLSSFQT